MYFEFKCGAHDCDVVVDVDAHDGIIEWQNLPQWVPTMRRGTTWIRWQIDLSDMYCPRSLENECNETWEVHIIA